MLNSVAGAWPNLQTLDQAGKPANYKHSSLLRTFVNCAHKHFFLPRRREGQIRQSVCPRLSLNFSRKAKEPILKDPQLWKVTQVNQWSGNALAYSVCVVSKKKSHSIVINTCNSRKNCHKFTRSFCRLDIFATQRQIVNNHKTVQLKKTQKTKTFYEFDPRPSMVHIHKTFLNSFLLKFLPKRCKF